MSTRVFYASAMLLMAAHANAQPTRAPDAARPIGSAPGALATNRLRAATLDLPLAERSYMLVNVPNDRTNELFEGQLALHFPIRSTIRASYDSAFQDRRAKWHVGWAGSFSMMSALRMTRESSAPVRTPSYMPRARLQWVGTRRDSAFTGPFAPLSDHDQWVVDAIVGHYSNGQDGCLFVGQTENTDGDCAFAGARPSVAELRVNRHDGSFSSHYVEGGAAWRHLAIDTAGFKDDSYVRSVWSAGLRYRNYTLLSGIGGGMTQELQDLYGPHRIRAVGSYSRETNDTRKVPGRLWVEGFIEAMPGAAAQVGSVRVSMEVGRSFDAMQGTGLFARYYRGQDDYNLGFLTKLSVVQLGMVLGGEARIGFRN